MQEAYELTKQDIAALKTADQVTIDIAWNEQGYYDGRIEATKDADPDGAPWRQFHRVPVGVETRVYINGPDDVYLRARACRHTFYGPFASEGLFQTVLLDLKPGDLLRVVLGADQSDGLRGAGMVRENIQIQATRPSAKGESTTRCYLVATFVNEELYRVIRTMTREEQRRYLMAHAEVSA